MSEEFHIQLYSFLPFPKELRCSFKLPGDPYEDRQSVEELKKLSVFFYRDMNHTQAILIPREQEELFLIRGVKGYRHMLIVDESFKIREWAPAVEEERFTTLKQYKEKHGDTKTWLMFNEEVVIINVKQDSITIG